MTQELMKSANIINSAELQELLGPPPVLSSESMNAESEGLRTGFRRKPDSIPMIADSR
jgi:hypothetical protein